MIKPRILGVCGHTAAGKGVACDYFKRELGDDIYFPVSATTRKPRKGEVDGVDYHFLTKESFEKKIQENLFLEYEEVHGNGIYYGTLAAPVEHATKLGQIICFEVDIQGIETLKSLFPNMYSFFIYCEENDRERRLISRGDSPSDFPERLKNAKTETMKARRFLKDGVIDALVGNRRTFKKRSLTTQGLVRFHGNIAHQLSFAYSKWDDPKSSLRYKTEPDKRCDSLDDIAVRAATMNIQ